MSITQAINAKVILIGGAPGTGKTTLGTALAARLGTTSLSIDDLLTAAKAVTTLESHPGLHLMRGMPYQEYFTNRSHQQLKADAELQHEIAWKLVEPVIRKHAAWGSAIVIDGWHLRPDKVAQLESDKVRSAWIVVTDSVLEQREKKNIDWLQGSSDPEQMFENFMARSLWYNDLIREQARMYQMNVLLQDGERTVEDLCQLILESLI